MKTLSYILAGLSVIGFLVLVFTTDTLLIPLISLFSSVILCATIFTLGEINEKLDEVNQKLDKAFGSKVAIEEPEPSLPQKECPSCGKTHDFDYLKCPHCNYKYE